MEFPEILEQLKERGEKNIDFSKYHENGLIISIHGKSTTNYWKIINGELICVDCKTVYSFSI